MGLTKGAFKRLITPGSGAIVWSTDHRLEVPRLIKNPVRTIMKWWWLRSGRPRGRW